MNKKIMNLLGITGLICLIGTTAAAGELDPGFGVDGRVAIEIGTHGDRAQAVAIQSDGKILLGGGSTDGDSQAFSLSRLLVDGRPDPSFNGDGTVLLDLGRGDDEILALGLTPDGHILAGGYMTNGTDRDFALLRFNPDGSLDTGFGYQGRVFTSVGNGHDEITAMTIDSSGAVLVAGSAEGTNGRVMVLGRYLEDGRLDAGFSDQGLSLIGIGQDVLAQGMAVDVDGRIFLSGSYADGPTTQMILVGFTPAGLIDRDFGVEGIAVTLYSKGISEGYGMLQEDDGSLLVAGSVGAEGERAAALFHFTAAGQPDTSFGEDGVLVTEVGPEDDVLYSLVGNRNHLSASGFTTTNSTRDFLLLTYEQGAAEEHIQAEQSLLTFMGQDADDASLPETTVMTTSFGLGESVSYGLALQQDGKVVTVGTSGEYGLTSAVVARYTVSDKDVPSAKSSSYVSTLPLNEVTATGAFTGGNINSSDTVTQRGVVFSIAPYPVCKTDCASGKVDNPDNPDNPDSGIPAVSDPKPTGTISTISTTLEVTTDVDATCRYTATRAGMDYSLMRLEFDTTGATGHKEPVGPLTDGETYTYWIRCENTATGDVNTTDTVISFTVDTSSTISLNTLKKTSTLLAGTAEKIGDFLVPEAKAATASTDTTTFFDNSFINKEGYTIDGGGSGLYSSILEKLTPDTRYYVRAYAIVDDAIYYGEQLEFETSSACFIATAAYGSILNPAVMVLRDFRDRYLQTNHPGRQLVAWYYKNSPPIADRVAASAAMRFAVRLALLPVIAISWLLLHPGAVSMLFWMACLTAILLRLRRRCLHTPLT